MSLVGLYFVRTPHANLEQLARAQAHAATLGLITEEVTGAHVLQMLSHPSPELSPAFGFVCDVFSGNSYAALVAAKHRVYGPLWIEFCAKTGQSLPRCNHPLFAPTMHNLVVCCTSLMNREYIHKRVELMGGTVERGFTKEVTHLIAGDSRSEKYKVALENKVPIMSTEWVDACWKEGNEQLMHANDVHFFKYRRPIFVGCLICVTGFNVDVRDEIEQDTVNNGGRYVPDLGSTVTHLIADRPTGEKYVVARRLGITVVTHAWFKRCLETSGLADERPFLCTPKPEAAQGVAEVDAGSVSAAEGAVTVVSNQTLLENCRFTFLGIKGARLQLLQKMVRSSGGMTARTLDERTTHVLVANARDVATHKASWAGWSRAPLVLLDRWLIETIATQTRQPFHAHVVKGEGGPLDQSLPLTSGPLLQAVIAPIAPPPASLALPDLNMFQNSWNGPLDRNLKTALTALPPAPPVQSAKDDRRPGDGASLGSPVPPQPNLASMMASLHFYLSSTLSAPMARICETQLQQCGGAVVDSKARASFVLYPPFMASPPADDKAVTPFWLEQCVDQERLLVPSHRFFFRPMQSPASKAATSMVVSLTGFDECEKKHLTYICQTMGMTVTDGFKKNLNTHLICWQMSGPKYDSAQRWNIPAVPLGWLQNMVACGTASAVLPAPAPAALSASGATAISAQGILCGTIVCVSKRLAARKLELLKTVRALGGKTRDVYDASCTHVIHQGKAHEGTREVRLARSNKAWVVSPMWLQHCLETQQHTSEQLFPSEYNPQMSLASIASQPTTYKGNLTAIRLRQAASRPMFDGAARETVAPCLPANASALTSPDISLPAGAVVDGAGSTVESLLRALDSTEVIGTSKATSRWARPRLRSSSLGSSERIQRMYTPFSLADMEKSGFARADNNSGEMAPRSNRNGTHGDFDPSSDDLLGSQTAIIYADPNHCERQRILQAIVDAAPGQTDDDRLMSTDEGLLLTDDADCTTVSPLSTIESAAAPYQSTKHIFLFSAMTPDQKARYTTALEALGGEVINTQYYDPRCSHVVVGSPGRNEKFMAAVASGKWVLHPSYIDDCVAKGILGHEEGYEWIAFAAELTPAESKLAMAATRWRHTVKETGHGAFYGWRVLLCNSMQQGFHRLLSAGGATILSESLPFGDVSTATHAFIEPRSIEMKQVDFTLLRAHNVKALLVQYIADYLTDDCSVDIIEERNTITTEPRSGEIVKLKRTPSRKRSSSDAGSSSSGSKRSKRVATSSSTNTTTTPIRN